MGGRPHPAAAHAPGVVGGGRRLEQGRVRRLPREVGRALRAQHEGDDIAGADGLRTIAGTSTTSSAQHERVGGRGVVELGYQ